MYVPEYHGCDMFGRDASLTQLLCDTPPWSRGIDVVQHELVDPRCVLSAVLHTPNEHVMYVRIHRAAQPTSLSPRSHTTSRSPCDTRNAQLYILNLTLRTRACILSVSATKLPPSSNERRTDAPVSGNSLDAILIFSTVRTYRRDQNPNGGQLTRLATQICMYARIE